MMDELSPKEKALYEKIKSAENSTLPMDELEQFEIGTIGRLKPRGLVEVFKNYQDKRKYIRALVEEPEDVEDITVLEE